MIEGGHTESEIANEQIELRAEIGVLSDGRLVAGQRVPGRRARPLVRKSGDQAELDPAEVEVEEFGHVPIQPVIELVEDGDVVFEGQGLGRGPQI
jgi:hypothetical protein